METLNQRMARLAEECAELIVIIQKIQHFNAQPAYEKRRAIIVELQNELAEQLADVTISLEAVSDFPNVGWWVERRNATQTAHNAPNAILRGKKPHYKGGWGAPTGKSAKGNMD